MDFNESASSRINMAMSRIGINSSEYDRSEIPGDLSPRRYSRITSTSEKFKKIFSSTSLVAMVFDSIKPPEAEAKIVRTSDTAFLELAEFFTLTNFSVPKIYLDSRDIGVILLEDLGSQTLIELVQNHSPEVRQYYSKAVGLIHELQLIPEREGFFPYERSFDEGILNREMNQFLDFVLPENIPTIDKTITLKVFAEISREFMSFKKVLVHRDFHSWNLMIDKSQNLKVIDFQDALMGPRCYDLVALLHERDIDLLLDNNLIDDLENQFFDFYQDNLLREIEYPIVQLQRDLKVSGLFMKVKKIRALTSYERWVPGTLKRIGRTLEKLASENSLYKNFSDLLKTNGVEI